MIHSFLNIRNDKHGVTGRREFFKKLAISGVATTGAMHVSWRDLVIAQAGELRKRGKRMILLWMDGGPSQFETFNPKPASANQGPAKAISTSMPGVQFAEFWPEMAKNAHKLAIIRSMQSNEADHFRAIKLVRTGYPINPTIAYPTWGSVVAHELYDPEFALPSFVRIGSPRIKTRDVNSGVLGAKYESFHIAEPGRIPDDVAPLVGESVLRRRLDLTDGLDIEFAAAGAVSTVKEKKDTYDRTTRFILSPKLDVFNLDNEPEKIRDAYGRTTFGQGCLLARRLIEEEVSFVEVFSIGSQNDQGWDTHKTGFKDTPQLCGEVDPAYSMLLQDLEDRGLLEDTLVVWMGEFGRTPKIKQDGGRDHYATGWITCLSGGGVKTGQVIGATDDDGVKVTDRPIGVPDLFQTFCKILGLDADHEYVTPQDQPLKLVKGGEVIKELF